LYYEIFDWSIRCNRALPELTQAVPNASTNQRLDVWFRTPGSVPATLPGIRLQPWLDDTDRVTQGQSGEITLIRVRGLADFLVRPAASSIECRPCPEAPSFSVRHFLLNQVLPRMISVRDPLVIHASAVATDRGALALIGPAGCGKSTLAASFVLSGAATLIADDSILVRLAGSSPCLVGAYTRSRLRPDSFGALGFDAQSIHGDRPAGGKHVLEFAPDQHAPSTPMAIRGLFLLHQAPSDQQSIEVRHLTGTAAVIALIKNSFLLAPGDHDLLRRQFEVATALIRTGCPCYALTYPRRFSDLPHVRDRILTVLGH
jgi:hypothetical protein